MPRRRNSYDSQDGAAGAQFVVNQFLRLDRQAQIVIVICLVVGALIALLIYEHNLHQQQAAIAGNPNLLLGNPSNATNDSSNRTNYLMDKEYFVISYNADLGTPNWVSWRVTPADLGRAPRKQMFDTDETLPGGFYRVTQHDYSGSGFDRGHMCPHGDRSADTQMSYATFVMTNIIPQAPNVNRKAWEQLESYCRELVSRDHVHLYVIAGPAGRGGKGSAGFRDQIGGGRVAVPAECWKIAVAVPESLGGDDLAKINASTRVISVLMPNDNSAVRDEWAGFRTSPSQIEAKTGLHFFDRLAAPVAAALRQKIDTEIIPPPRTPSFQ